MLAHLSIKNYALIEDLETVFHPGFTIITGETGAGKSIILGALSLILGQRADTKVLYDSSRKCIVEGTFSIGSYALQSWFESHTLDHSDIAILRREITPDARSRAFINDTPVSLAVLRELGEKLVDVHSQHQNLLIAERGFQLSLVDGFAGAANLVAGMAEAWKKQREIEDTLRELQESAARASQELDYQSYLYGELENANPLAGENVALEQEAELLSNVETVKSVLTQIIYSLNLSDQNLLQQLTTVAAQLQQCSRYHPAAAMLENRLKSVLIELKDIAAEIEQIEEKTSYNPERLALVNSRLDLINRLMQKHRVSSPEELIEIKNRLDEQINRAGDMNQQIEHMLGRLDEAVEATRQAASRLSEARLFVIPGMQAKFQEVLRQLGMPHARIEIDHHKTEQPGISGQDNIKFMFSANPGTDAREIGQTASGGEISRIMLAVKSLISEKKLLPTLVFDEIDAGVSGEVAAMTSRIMKELSCRMQVFAITHLPQIAARGDHHFEVFKKLENSKTKTFVRKLNPDERVETIARMLSGKNLTEAALNAAKQLISEGF